MAGSERPFFSLRSNNTSQQQQHTHTLGANICSSAAVENAPFHFERGLISILLHPVLVRNYQQQQREPADRPVARPRSAEEAF
jgi:hypothetical protein